MGIVQNSILLMPSEVLFCICKIHQRLHPKLKTAILTYLKYPAEEDSHDPRHLADLCDQVAAVAEKREERRLQEGRVPHTRELGDDGSQAADDRAQADRANQDGEELDDGQDHGVELEALPLGQRDFGVLLDGRAEDDRDRVVQEALAEDEAVEHRVHVQVLINQYHLKRV